MQRFLGVFAGIVLALCATLPTYVVLVILETPAGALLVALALLDLGVLLAIAGLVLRRRAVTFVGAIVLMLPWFEVVYVDGGSWGWLFFPVAIAVAAGFSIRRRDLRPA